MTSKPVKAGKAPAPPRRGGRPSKDEAGQIEARIQNAARDLFFAHGYGATSIETIARAAQVSKRTFYTRYKDKPDLFRAVVHRVLESLKPADGSSVFEGDGNFEAVLQHVAEAMLRAALSKHLLSLQRLLLAEAPRFPELIEVMNRQGARQQAIDGIAQLLKKEAGAKRIALENPAFTAEQFIHLAMGAPQRHALMLEKPMSDAEIKKWAQQSVALFLKGWCGN